VRVVSIVSCMCLCGQIEHGVIVVDISATGLAYDVFHGGNFKRIITGGTMGLCHLVTV